MAEDNKDLPNKEKQRERQRGSITGPRRALALTVLTAGAALAGIGLLQNNNNPENGSNTPAATEAFDSQEFADRLLQQHPDALVFLGGKIELSLGKTGSGNLIPRIRTEPNLQPEHAAFPNTFSVSEIKLINGVPYDSTRSNYFTIENYSAVPGENVDDEPLSNLNAPLNQNWLALEITKTDGNEVFGFISLSDQTDEYWDVEEHVAPTMLSSTLGSDSLASINITAHQVKP